MPIADTIAAIATAPGRAALGTVRLSGPDARRIAEGLLGNIGWEPWKARLAHLMDAQGHTIDQVLVTYFPAPKSYTAEDVVEISCHGSPVVLRHAVERALALGARLANPGEFTLRAFLNGRIDLARAEAVRDLIDATTLYQARVAAQQVDGSVSRRVAPLKAALVELIALLEAGIDFAEDDVSVAPVAEILRRIEPVLEGTRQLAASFQYGGLVTQGLTLAIAGRPNVGKSSLFNRLLKQERAIVTEIPGTTRDLVTETASIGGIPVKLCDTAGIRRTDERVETLGIERSYQAMADADLTLVVLDLGQAFTAEDEELIGRAGPGALVVGNKRDLGRGAGNWPPLVAVSALTGDGIAALRQAILAAVAPEGVFERETGFITSLRHEQLLRESAGWLEKAREAAKAGTPHEMLLLDLYAALRGLDAITGATTADDILNRIFSTFCIGK